MLQLLIIDFYLFISVHLYYFRYSFYLLTNTYQQFFINFVLVDIKTFINFITVVGYYSRYSIDVIFLGDPDEDVN